MSNSPRGLTFEAVAAVCQALVADGTAPDQISLREIRNVTGTGSLSTIKDHLNRWQSDRRSQPLGQSIVADADVSSTIGDDLPSDPEGDARIFVARLSTTEARFAEAEQKLCVAENETNRLAAENIKLRDLVSRQRGRLIDVGRHEARLTELAVKLANEKDVLVAELEQLRGHAGPLAMAEALARGLPPTRCPAQSNAPYTVSVPPGVEASS